MRRGVSNFETVLCSGLCLVAGAIIGALAAPAATDPQPVPVVTPDVPAIELAEPELVIVTDASGKRVTNAAVETAAKELDLGSWNVIAIPKPGDVGWTRQIVVSGGGPRPPPGPTPVPQPVPDPVPVPTKVTAVTYVYEKDSGSVPPAVLAALNTLNRQGIIATQHEIDTTDGDDQIPDQYKAVVPAAKEAGLPALVVTAGAVVLRTVKAPTTEAQVIEAAK